MNKLAAAPRMAFDVTTLLHQVDSLGKLYAEKQFNASSSRVRKELSAAVSKLSLALETPEEVVDRVVYMVNSFCFRDLLTPGVPADIIWNSQWILS